MKKMSRFLSITLTVFLLAVSLVTAVSAKSSGPKTAYETEGCELVESAIYYDDENEPVEKTVYTYDEKGNILTDKNYEYYFDTKEYLLVELNEYSYDTNGNLIEFKHSEDYSHVEMKLRAKREYTYDAAGNRISQKYYRWSSEDDALVLNEEFNYVYDEKNQLISQETIYFDVDWEGNPDIGGRKSEYSYNAAGKAVSYIDYNLTDYDSKSWEPCEKAFMTYDDAGNLSKMEYQELNSNDEWEICDISTYDENGNCLTESFIEDGICVDLFTSTYDDQGRKLSELQERRDGTTAEDPMVPKYKEVYTYSDTEQTYKSYEWKDDAWADWYGYRSVYELNAAGNPTKEITYNWNESDWELSYTMGYTYTVFHKVAKVEAVEPTCNDAGVKEHFACPCGEKHYTDAEGKNEIADFNAWKNADGKIEALEHDYAKDTGLCVRCGEAKPASGAGKVVLAVSLSVVGVAVVAYVASFVYWKQKEVAVVSFLKPSYQAIDKLFAKKSVPAAVKEAGVEVPVEETPVVEETPAVEETPVEKAEEPAQKDQ